jgi:hypothetical protein
MKRGSQQRHPCLLSLRIVLVRLPSSPRWLIFQNIIPIFSFRIIRVLKGKKIWPWPGRSQLRHIGLAKTD